MSWLAFSMVTSLSCALIPKDAHTLEITVEPASIEIAEQSSARVGIFVNSANNLISIGVEVSFDPSILAVSNATKNQDPLVGFILDEDGNPNTTSDQYSSPVVEMDNTNGTVTMLGGRMMGTVTTGLSGKVFLGSITFQRINIGSSDISVDLARYHPEHPVKTFDNFVNIDGTVDEPTNLGVLAVITVLSDQDLDGLPDSHETGIYGTNPALADTDDDGIDDGEELDEWNAMDCSGCGCSNCWNCDIDVDGQANNLLDKDADGDGFSDGIEILAGNDPADPDDHPVSSSLPAAILLLLQ